MIERALGRRVASTRRAAWGFTNRTDLITLDDGEQVVVQRYRRRGDAEYRLSVMRGLWTPARHAGVPLPRVRAFDLDDDPPWAIYDVLPGVPAAEAGELGVGGPRFPRTARSMGELLAAFRDLPTAGLALDDSWADPPRLAESAAAWARRIGVGKVDRHLDAVPDLLGGRPAVLAHGDFAPVNVLLDGETISGLLDLEAARLADPLFDAAWWAWSVGFSSPEVLEAAWPAFLGGAGIDANEPGLADRIRLLQVLRMLELLGTDKLTPDVAGIVEDRLRTTLRR
jgi:aminoglycoside phosphotransferase (APT) family kinase protein